MKISALTLAALVSAFSCKARPEIRSGQHFHAKPSHDSFRAFVVDAANMTHQHRLKHLNSPLADLSSDTTVSIVATLPVSRSNGCLDIARLYADNIVYSGLRAAATSISVVLAAESADDALLMDEVKTYLRRRLPGVSISVDAYDKLSNAGARKVWKESRLLMDLDAKRHAILFTAFSTDSKTLASQKASDTHVTSLVIWDWRNVLRAFKEQAEVFRAGYACDRKGLLFNNVWVRASYVQDLPEPRESNIPDLLVTVTDYAWLWLEYGHAPLAHDPEAAMSWQNTHTISICNSNLDALKPGTCHDADLQSKFPPSVFIACACEGNKNSSQIKTLSMQQAVTLCSAPAES